MEVTFTSPTQNETGEFVCEVNAITEAGHGVVFSTSVEVTMSQPTMSDLVSTHVADKLCRWSSSVPFTFHFPGSMLDIKSVLFVSDFVTYHLDKHQHFLLSLQTFQIYSQSRLYLHQMGPSWAF